jgi:hypothetical protein
MLVLEPIFEADLPPEQYAYRPGRNAQQAVLEVGALLDHGHPEVVDADLADYFGSIPRELVPTANAIGLLVNPSAPGADLDRQEAERVATGIVRRLLS